MSSNEPSMMDKLKQSMHNAADTIKESAHDVFDKVTGHSQSATQQAKHELPTSIQEKGQAAEMRGEAMGKEMGAKFHDVKATVADKVEGAAQSIEDAKAKASEKLEQVKDKIMAPKVVSAECVRSDEHAHKLYHSDTHTKTVIDPASSNATTILTTHSHPTDPDNVPFA